MVRRAIALIGLLAVACGDWPDPFADGVCLVGLPDSDLDVARCLWPDLPERCHNDAFLVRERELPEDRAGQYTPRGGAVIDPDVTDPLDRAVTIAHEIGHGIGLDHGESLPCGVMRPGGYERTCIARLCGLRR